MLWSNVKKYPKPLRLSILEGMAAALMLGGGMVFVVPFAVQLGANSMEIGLLTALPALFAAWIQLGSTKMLEVYKTRKNAVIVSVFFQAISWLLIALIPFIFQKNQVIWLILFTTAGTTIGSICGPLWQSWMRVLTPKEILGEYFGTRNAIIGTSTFLSLLGCGFVLQLIEPTQSVLVFSGIFLLSFIGRTLSSIIFTRIEEPEACELNELCKQESTKKQVIGVINFIEQLGKDNFGHFVLYGTLMSFALALVGPFFSLYLLNDLGLKNDYFSYTLIISSSAIATLITLPYWGKVIDTYGTIKVLRATGLLGSIYPLALFFIREPSGLVLAEFLGGMIFAGLNLSLASFIYQSFPQEKIIKYAGYQGALFGTATAIGVILSGIAQTQNILIGIITNTFYFICLAAVIIRLAIHTTLSRKIQNIGEKQHIHTEKLVISTLALNPLIEPLAGNAFTILSTTQSTLKKATRETIKIARTIEQNGKGAIKKAGKLARERVSEIEKITENEIKKISSNSRKK